MQQSTPAPGTSLRERKKTAKQERILEAATRSFTEKSYEAVVTTEIAEAAEVGVSTLFRYAGSKAELLVAVMNSRFAEGIEAGLSEAAGGRAMAESIIAILRPLIEESMTHSENMLVHECEALFGSAEHREEATSSVSRVEQAILQVLLPHQAKSWDPSAGLEDIAHAIYTVLYLDIVKVIIGRSTMADLPARAWRSVDFLTGALLKTWIRRVRRKMRGRKRGIWSGLVCSLCEWVVSKPSCLKASWAGLRASASGSCRNRPASKLVEPACERQRVGRVEATVGVFGALWLGLLFGF